MGQRIEKDTLGSIAVPDDRFWAAQTQRSLQNFPIGGERMPLSVVRGFGHLKRACAQVNRELGKLDPARADAIIRAADEVITGQLDDHFPLRVWQTGSGTQTNMNANEVIAHRANALLSDADTPVHPNDHVNLAQSSNDTFPTVMHLAAVTEIEARLLPALDRLHATLQQKQARYAGLVKIGRTHLQDATPLTLGQEISGWAAMLEQTRAMVRAALPALRQLAIGGTAVGTGLNAHPRFGELVAAELSRLTGHELSSAANKFHALTSHDALVFAHGALKALAANLMKIANDIRWLASGPRCGIGELTLPANEPGSSIMPGKINPTQSEAITMVACQVLGNDTTIGIAAAQGNFELNVYKPVIIYNFLQSTELLADAMDSFDQRCVQGLEANEERIDALLNESLMLVTALNPHVGYECAAKIAKTAYEQNSTLKQAAVDLGMLTEEEFDRYVRPEEMVSPKD